MALTQVQSGMLNSDSQNYGFKNRIINGAMLIDQRNAGASVTPTDAQFTLDRWRFFLSQASKLTMQQNQGSVTPPAGFAKYLGITSSSAYTVGSSERFSLMTSFESSNVSDFAWGTASASPVTLSFWARSSLTGTFGGAVRNWAYTYSYPFSYTISSANTWTYITVSITAPPAGTWVMDGSNGGAIEVLFNLGAGATSSGTAGAWASANYTSATGATSVVGTSGATWYVTGVQLESGTVPTSFELRSYSKELMMCQRYYELTGFGNIAIFESGSTYVMNLVYKVTKRAQPSIGLYWTSNIRVRQFGTSDRDASSPGVGSTAGSSNGGYIKINGFGSVGATSSVAGIGFTTSSENGDLFSISAEL